MGMGRIPWHPNAIGAQDGPVRQRWAVSNTGLKTGPAAAALACLNAGLLNSIEFGHKVGWHDLIAQAIIQ